MKGYYPIYQVEYLERIRLTHCVMLAHSLKQADEWVDKNRTASSNIYYYVGNWVSVLEEEL
jgi:hypothetical protein